MKKMIVLISIISVIVSCNDKSSNEIMDKTTKTFSANSTKVGLHSTITLTYKGKDLIAQRTVSKLDENESHNNVIYFDTKVTIHHLNDGGVEIFSEGKNLWFIPFLVASEPVNFETGICWRYYCTCGGYPSFNTSGCGVIASPTEVGCGIDINTEPCPSSCIGFAMKVQCGTQQNLDDVDPFSIYTGGVLVEAENVRIIDPDGTGFNPKNTIDFYQRSDGKILKLDDAKKAGYYNH